MIYQNSKNPLLPLEWHFPDCEARVMADGKLYLYGSMDTREETYCSNTYHVASTADLYNWTIHPPSFKAQDALWAKNGYMDPEGKIMLYAPDAIEKNDRYYLYMCLSDGSEGVAVSDKPEGPFINSQRIPVSGIDPSIFIDDDGQAYYYWGQFSANAVKMNENMCDIQEDSLVEGILTEKIHYFHEGISMRKRDGIYYLVFTDISRGKASCLGYATSSSPLGQFTYRGIIIDNDGCDPGTWNNHGSIQEYKGQWYVFYHRSSRNCKYMRRVCAEPIYFKDDGTIPEVKMTSQGIGRPFAPGEWIPAYTACGLHGKSYLYPHKSTEALINICDGDRAVFRYIEAKDPLSRMNFTACGTGFVSVFANKQYCGGGDIAAGNVPVHIAAGTHEIELLFSNTSACVWQGMSFE